MRYTLLRSEIVRVKVFRYRSTHGPINNIFKIVLRDRPFGQYRIYDSRSARIAVPSLPCENRVRLKRFLMDQSRNADRARHVNIEYVYQVNMIQ